MGPGTSTGATDGMGELRQCPTALVNAIGGPEAPAAEDAGLVELEFEDFLVEGLHQTFRGALPDGGADGTRVAAVADENQRAAALAGPGDAADAVRAVGDLADQHDVRIEPAERIERGVDPGRRQAVQTEARELAGKRDRRRLVGIDNQRDLAGCAHLRFLCRASEKLCPPGCEALFGRVPESMINDVELTETIELSALIH